MAWIKARARDLFLFSVFSVITFNCSQEKPSCKGLAPDRTLAPSDEATMPSHDELREMARACADGPALADDCAEDLWETRAQADAAGCSNEIDALLSCVEDGDAGGDGEEWACDAAELGWRECVGAPTAAEAIMVPSERAPSPPSARVPSRPASLDLVRR